MREKRTVRHQIGRRDREEQKREGKGRGRGEDEGKWVAGNEVEKVEKSIKEWRVRRGEEENENLEVKEGGDTEGNGRQQFDGQGKN